MGPPNEQGFREPRTFLVPPPILAAPRVGPVMIHSEDVPDRRGATAFMSSAARNGDWTLPRLFRGFVCMGQLDIDLTQVRIGPGTSEIEVISIMGQINILVPDSLRVECTGDSTMGEFKMIRRVDSTPSPDAPLVRIKGTAFMGAVTVKVLDPNSPGWLKKLARRLRQG